MQVANYFHSVTEVKNCESELKVVRSTVKQIRALLLENWRQGGNLDGYYSMLDVKESEIRHLQGRVQAISLQRIIGGYDMVWWTNFFLFGSVFLTAALVGFDKYQDSNKGVNIPEAAYFEAVGAGLSVIFVAARTYFSKQNKLQKEVDLFIKYCDDELRKLVVFQNLEDRSTYETKINLIMRLKNDGLCKEHCSSLLRDLLGKTGKVPEQVTSGGGQGDQNRIVSTSRKDCRTRAQLDLYLFRSLMSCANLQEAQEPKPHKFLSFSFTPGKTSPASRDSRKQEHVSHGTLEANLEGLKSRADLHKTSQQQNMQKQTFDSVGPKVLAVNKFLQRGMQAALRAAEEGKDPVRRGDIPDVLDVV